MAPGGSIRDDEVVEACDLLGVAMVFTHHRHCACKFVPSIDRQLC